MKAKNSLSIASLSVITSLVIGLINTGSAVLAYTVFIHARPEQSQELKPLTETTPQPNGPETIANNPAAENATAASTNSKKASLARPTKVRKPQATVVIGQPALPTQIITKPDGQIEYKWCSGQNPQLEDGVCEAILSIASNPTPSNPHLSEKVLQWLSLLPSNSTLAMQENSWLPKSTGGGEMDVVMHTQAYGDIKLHVTLEKINNIWVVTDGKIA